MPNNFPENLIKGRIAETVFEQMFREWKGFDVYPLGYEYTLPILKQFKDDLFHQPHKDTIEKILHNFDTAPDFLLVKPDKSELFVVEVKYQEVYTHEYILQYAAELKAKWNPAWLFVATKTSFHFSPANEIINNPTTPMPPLAKTWIPPETQQKYQKLIQEFEK